MTTAKQRHNNRFISALTQQTVAVVLAGGRGASLGSLTEWRAKAAVPFGGKFRIIDFALSNCFNSQILKVLVLTQYKSHSLIKHIRNGWIQRKSRQLGGIDIVPAQQWTDDQSWYRGSADAVFQALDIIKSQDPEQVLIVAGDNVYSLDYGEMLAKHTASGADITLCCTIVPQSQATRYGVAQIDKKGRLTAFDEMPDEPVGLPTAPDMSLVSMGIYLFSTDILDKHLSIDANDPHSQHNLGRNIIPNILASGGKVQAYLYRSPVAEHPPYWQDIWTIDNYYQANMALLSSVPPLDLYHSDWPFRTHQDQLPPARFSGRDKGCSNKNSMVSGGCKINNSTLESSMLFSNVTVEENCHLSGVLALPGSHIGAGSRLKNVILDNRCTIEPGTIIGENITHDRERYNVTEGGRILISNFQSPYL